MKSTTSTLTPQDYALSGPAFLRRRYPHRLSLVDLSRELQISRTHLYKRLKNGSLKLPINKNEMGRPYLLTDDLISYLYPNFKTALSPDPAPEKRGPGRPRKSSSLSIGGAQ